MWERIRAASDPLLDSPPVPVITVAGAKAAILVTTSDHDDLIQAYIDAALKLIEGPQGIGIAVQRRQWTLTLDAFPATIEIPLMPVLWVDSIAYVDTDGAAQTLAADQYTVDTKSVVARIVPSYGNAWPSVRSHINVITVTFTAGYAQGEGIPPDLITAMYQTIGHWYENRESVVLSQTANEVPQSAQAVFDRYRSGRFG